MQTTVLYIGSALKWSLFFLADDQVSLLTTDGDPTFIIRKNGAISGSDTVTVTDRFTSEGTGAVDQFYLLSWTPSDQTEGTQYSIEQYVEIGGDTYPGEVLHITIKEPERGNDDANETEPPTAEAIAAAVWSDDDRSLTDKAGFALSTESIAAIELALMSDDDGQALKAALLAVINSGLDLPALELAAIADAVWTRDERSITDKANFGLSTSERSATATAVWSSGVRSLTDKTDFVLADASITHLKFSTGAINNNAVAGSFLTAGKFATDAFPDRLFTDAAVSKLAAPALASLVEVLAQIATRLAASSYVPPLSDVGTRAALGLADDDLDEQLAAILDAAGTGGEGSTVQVIVTPLSGNIRSRVTNFDLQTFVDDLSAIGPLTVTGSNNQLLDVGALGSNAKVWIQSAKDESIRYEGTLTTNAEDGTAFYVAPPAAVVTAKSSWIWSLRDITGAPSGKGKYLIGGTFEVSIAARSPA
jgi:hypothetical protein